MFDFRTTLKEDDHALNNGNIALAMFNYWLVNFAFGDEEYPYFYTKEIGDEASEKFIVLFRKYKDMVLESEVYLAFKDEMRVFESYRHYFNHFERDIRNSYSD